MLNISIIGNAAEREKINMMVKQYCASSGIDIEPDLFKSAQDALVGGVAYGICFICTGGAEGFLNARQMREADKNCRIVFVDDTDEYAIKGIRLHFTDFIVRPVEFRHIVRAMTLCTAGEK